MILSFIINPDRFFSDWHQSYYSFYSEVFKRTDLASNIIQVVKFVNKELSFVSVLGLWLLGVLFLVLHAITISIGTITASNAVIYITFIVNGALWFFLLFKELLERPYSMKVIFYTFCLFFFYFAGIIQYISGRFPWVIYRDNDTVLKANIILFIFTLCYMLGSQLAVERNIDFSSEKTIKEFKISHTRMMIISTVSLGVFMNKLIRVGFSGLFSRLSVREAIDYGESSAFTLLIKQLLMALQCVAVLVAILGVKQDRKKISYFIFNFVLLLCTYPPGMISRYAVATIYGSIFILMFDSFKKNRNFILFFCVAYTILFPFLNNFRHTDFADVDTMKALSKTVEGIQTDWLAEDYDAYTTFTLTFDRVKSEGMSMGYQLLGVLLFFVPRTMWPNKPIGSGAYMGEKLGWDFTNVSCPIPGEAYINFGVIGVVAFGLIFGFISTIMDRFYWDKHSNIKTKFEILYSISLMMFFFMMRGDMLSSWAYLIAFVIVWFAMTYTFPEKEQEAA